MDSPAVPVNEDIDVLLLHEHPNLLNQCCSLLSEEWKLSTTARMHMLERSCKDLPCSLLLVVYTNGTKDVIGHSRFSRMFESQKCLITSVIIAKRWRGKGLGKYIMFKTEELAKMYGFSTACLTTHDKQDFYERLGYIYSYISKLDGTGDHVQINSIHVPNLEGTENRRIISKQISAGPLPPPLPTASSTRPYSKKVWMEKQIM